MIPALVIAGVGSGVGKTTVTLGLLETLRRRGLKVQPFKVGPDFIDPAFHALVAGRPSYSLDGWMCSREHVRATVARHAADADLALIEGVMGCFDGRGAQNDEGSTAEIAKWLGAPVVLVADAWAMARSAGAVVLGFESFDPELRLAGVLFNRVAGDTHWRWLREAVTARCRTVPLGYLPRRESLALPERHLGLVTAAEHGLPATLLDELSAAMTATVDLDRLLALARSDVAPAAPAMRDPTPRSLARIGVARDLAFQFYYPANLDLLRAAGAELVFWSPLEDAELPDVDALYLGGGYPEVYARELARQRAHARGRPGVRRGRWSRLRRMRRAPLPRGGAGGRVRPAPSHGRPAPDGRADGSKASHPRLCRGRDDPRDASRPCRHHGPRPRVPRFADRPRA